jgi:8-oxo-dGTP pyrophosphatase MutT (NUDIX family)
VFNLLREEFVSPRTGAVIDATVIDSPDWVNVIPLTHDGQVVLIHQYRFGPQSSVLEIPGGLIDPGELPAEAARRELREETGYACERVLSLGSVSPNPAFIRNRLHCFVAEGCVLEGEQEQDPGEDIRVELVPFAEIDSIIVRGGLDHALVQIAFQRLALLRAGHTFD